MKLKELIDKMALDENLELFITDKNGKEKYLYGSKNEIPNEYLEYEIDSFFVSHEILVIDIYQK